MIPPDAPCARPVRPLDLERYAHVVVLTGAGISVASGIRPYRGPGGLWTTHPESVALATRETLARDPARVWSLFGSMREEVRAATPNAAHTALADWEKRLRARGATLTVLTQNVDELHVRAGSDTVVELHGNLFRSRCTASPLPAFRDESSHTDALLCPQCSSPLRPDVVLFGEPMNVDTEWAAKKALRDCDLFVAVGTSGSVAPASNFVRWATTNEARTLYVNLEPMSPHDPAYREVYLGPAETVLPELLSQ